MRRLRLGYTALTDYVYYHTYTSERGLNTSSSARADFDLGVLKPYATVQGVNSRARPNAEIDLRARHHDLTYGAGVGAEDRVANHADRERHVGQAGLRCRSGIPRRRPPREPGRPPQDPRRGRRARLDAADDVLGDGGARAAAVRPVAGARFEHVARCRRRSHSVRSAW